MAARVLSNLKNITAQNAKRAQRAFLCGSLQGRRRSKRERSERLQTAKPCLQGRRPSPQAVSASGLRPLLAAVFFLEFPVKLRLLIVQINHPAIDESNFNLARPHVENIASGNDEGG
jgi:hypothetical protein